MDFGGHDDEAKAIVVQPDDKIVVAGYSVELDADDVPSRDFALARYNPDGSLDSTFSDDGRRTTNFADDTAHDIALQADGRIVVGGTASGGFALARYNPDGTLDLGFSGNGRVTLGLADAQGSGARAIVVQPTGKIVAAGGRSGDFALARLGTNGSLDASFGGDGVVTTSFGESGGGAAAASDVLFRSGRLLAAGYANRGFALARYELDGHLDPGFSGDGMVTTDMGYEYARASSIAISPSGRIVVGGSGYSYILDYTASYGLLARYLSSNGPADADADGVLDSRDLCPQVFAPQHSDGCHRFRRSISLVLLKTDRKHRFFSGTLSGACVSDSRVRVFKIKRGGRRVKVAGATPYYNPDDARWSYSIPTNRTRGRYYAKLRRELTPGGWCSAARSPVLKLRRK
jgi:uncharacterized delta-60 repeat protein